MLSEPEDWHDDQDVTENLDLFYKEKGKCPYELRKYAHRHLRLYLKHLESRMKRKGLCKKLQNSGSTTEGLKVNDEMEFDVMSIFTGENLKITNIVGYPGYVHLSIKGGGQRFKENALQRFVDSNYNYLSPSLYMQENFEQIKILVEEELEELEHETQIKVKKNGPSICLTFKREEGDLLFKADIVPTIEIKENGKSINCLYSILLYLLS